MYKTKPRFPCLMPSDAPLRVLALNASLKHEPTLSSTGELATLVLDEIRALATVHTEVVRLSDAKLPVGLGFRESPEDDWPGLVTKIKAADIVLFCTPIWWGGRSSLLQRGFTLPPECAAYWVGEVGQPTSQDRDKRLKNMATMHMAKGLAQNLVYYARLLKAHPQTFVAGNAKCCEMHAGLKAPA